MTVLDLGGWWCETQTPIPGTASRRLRVIRCRECHRRLYDPVSRRMLIGPQCLRALQGAAKAVERRHEVHPDQLVLV